MCICSANNNSCCVGSSATPIAAASAIAHSALRLVQCCAGNPYQSRSNSSKRYQVHMKIQGLHMSPDSLRQQLVPVLQLASRLVASYQLQPVVVCIRDDRRLSVMSGMQCHQGLLLCTQHLQVHLLSMNCCV
jgi:hypothetical protein